MSLGQPSRGKDGGIMHERETPSQIIRFPLRIRLLLGYAVVLLVFLGSGVVGFQQFERVHQANEMLQDQAKQLIAAEALSRSVSGLITAVDTGLLSEDGEQFKTLVNAALLDVQDKHEKLSKLLEESAPLDVAVSVLVGDTRPMVAQAQGGSWSVLRRNRLTRLNDKVARVQQTINNIVRDAQDSQARTFETIESVHRAMRMTMVVSLLLSFAVSFISGAVTYQDIVRLLSILVVGAQRLAQGDLEHRVQITSGDELAALADAFNSMADQLQELYAGMERRIAERTKDLEMLAEQMKASAEIGQAAATMLDLESLQRHVVTLISERFGFYHTGLFLLDDVGRYVVLQAASSPGGQRMLARQHRLRVGEGVVGYVVETGEAHIAATVGKDAVFFNNPDLPETRSEVALPLRARGRILGALDVQSTEEDAFTQDNMTVLQMMADQVAMALDNARLYQTAQADAQELRRLYGEYERRAWSSYVRSVQGRRYLRGHGVFSDATWYPEMKRAIEKKDMVRVEPGSEEEKAAASVALPIIVRGQTVGVIDLRKPSTEKWAQGDIELVQTVVSQLGSAMESARLYQDTQRRAAQSQLVEEIAARMRGTLDVASVARTAVNEIRYRLGATQVSLYLASPAAEVTETESVPAERAADESSEVDS